MIMESITPVDDDGHRPPDMSPSIFQQKIILATYHVHFSRPGYIKDYMINKISSKNLKGNLKLTTRDAEARKTLAIDAACWKDLCDVFDVAIPSLHRRTFPSADANAPDYDTAPSSLIATHCGTLLKDLEILTDLVAIARNLLTVGETVQNLAVKLQFDQLIFSLIHTCVKITARGFDGDTGAVEEERGQAVINAYKKLLITCLQFLNNLVAQNERRKLTLWVELFDNSTERENLNVDYPGNQPESLAAPNQPTGDAEDRRDSSDSEPTSAAAPATSSEETNASADPGSQRPPSPFLLFLGREGADIRRRLAENGDEADPTKVATECERKWKEMSEDARKMWQAQYDEIMARYRDAMSIKEPERTRDQVAEALVTRSLQTLQLDHDEASKGKASSPQGPLDEKSQWPSNLSLGGYSVTNPLTGEKKEESLAEQADFRMTYTAAYGSDILQRGKDDLMKRLESFPDRTAQSSQQGPLHPESSISEQVSAGPTHTATEEPVEYSEEEDESEDDYGEVGDDGRGLLTDIPLILAPAEIEVLPMIIMSGIVPPAASAPGHGSTAEEIHAIKNMHTVRCHLLLAQDNGRNLLRELLIFVAAWDLREDELYYRFMVKIMDAILMNGLMPFSYHAFRETKDIISPAQAVIMKLLTNIFRQRQAASAKTKSSVALEADDVSDQYPPKVDVHLVNFLFTEFRRHIIPQTCALIFLQGQIRARNAYPEDFPLNLWDMERMYEGVYQYLEFFAVMTEHPVWKGMMADWDIASELVTLLKELDAAIPKKKPFATPRRSNGPENSQRPTNPATAPPAVSVERPYDRSAPSMPMTVPELEDPDPDAFTEESPEDASEFEWRNLKKLAVLVLSSLVWKSRKIQDQVREHGGIEAVLACTNYDEHNPYIREHAIMCLRFLTEGNVSNQAVIHALEPQKPVPAEVLDNAGYETVMDDNGQVRLKRKEGAARATAGSASRTATSSATASASAEASAGEKAASSLSSSPAAALGAATGIDPTNLQNLVGSESLLANLPAWMQQVMKDVPGGVSKTVENDPEKVAALAKLDRAFGVDKKG